MNWPSYAEDISERQEESIESRSPYPPIDGVSRSPKGYRRLGPQVARGPDNLTLELTLTQRPMRIVRPFGPGIRWIPEIGPHRLGLTQRPEGDAALLPSIAAWQREGADTVVSLLESIEIHNLGLANEEAACKALGMAFHQLPVPNGGTPRAVSEVESLLESILLDLRRGKGVVIHCLAGIGRTGLLAACVLSRLEVGIEEIFPLLTRARGISVPDNDTQIAWVHRFAAAVE